MALHLMTSSASIYHHYQERRNLYTAVYNELFERVRDHPQNVMKRNAAAQAAEAARQLGLIKRFLRADVKYLEV
jgi:AcrR family transcriptional regulator